MSFWLWFVLLLLAPAAGIIGLVQGRRRARAEREAEAASRDSVSRSADGDATP